jgi:hypothetical protein
MPGLLLMRVYAIVIFTVAAALIACDDRSPKVAAGQSANAPKTAASADQTGDGMLPAGTYAGTLAVPTTIVAPKATFNVVTKQMDFPATVQPSIALVPFPGGDLTLDGEGNYLMPKWSDGPKNGRYRFDGANHTVAFVSGPLTGTNGALSLSPDGCPTIVVNLPAGKDEGKPKQLQVSFSNNTPNPAAADRMANGKQPARTDPGPTAGDDAHATKPAPNPGVAGTLLISGSAPTRRISLSDGKIDNTLPDGRVDRHPVSKRDEYLTTSLEGYDCLLQIVDGTGKPAGKRFLIQTRDSVVPHDAEASLSPDGQKIAYYVNFSAFKAALELVIYSEVRVADRNGKVLASFPGYSYPTWTPTGELVMAGAMAQSGGQYLPESKTGLFFVKSLDATPQPFGDHTQPPALPKVSPDGKQVAYLEAGSVWTCDRDGRNRKKQCVPEGSLNYVADIAWSPASDQLAISIIGSVTDPHVELLRLADGHRSRLRDSQGRTVQPGAHLVWLP